MMNVAGPWEVLGHANDLLGHEAYRLQAFGPSAPAIQTRFGLVDARRETKIEQLRQSLNL